VKPRLYLLNRHLKVKGRNKPRVSGKNRETGTKHWERLIKALMQGGGGQERNWSDQRSVILTMDGNPSRGRRGSCEVTFGSHSGESRHRARGQGIKTRKVFSLEAGEEDREGSPMEEESVSSETGSKSAGPGVERGGLEGQIYRLVTLSVVQTLSKVELKKMSRGEKGAGY